MLRFPADQAMVRDDRQQVWSSSDALIIAN
jgi:hypothetical protein